MSFHLLKFDAPTGLKEIFSRLNGLFARFHKGAGHYEGIARLPDWRLLVDIGESDREYVISGDIPGVKQEDVSVSIRDGMLLIQGERKQEMASAGMHFYRRECPAGFFVRSFEIPEDAQSQVKTEFKDGMFKLTLAKTMKTGIIG